VIFAPLALTLISSMKKIPTLFAVLLLPFASQAAIVTKTVSYQQDGVTLQGYLAYDDRVTPDHKAPGVLVIHEWWGLNDYIKSRARQIAEWGYVAFAPDMYGEGQMTTDPKEAGAYAGKLYGKPILAERAKAGLDQLLKTDLVDDKRVASIGFCFGGTASLALAYSGAPLAAVATFHGGLIPVPAGFGAKTTPKFLILHGALDPLVPKKAVDEFETTANNEKLDYQLILYSGAVHAFSNPDADKASAAGLKGVGYNEAAAKHSWEQLKTFLSEAFA
jgi:dienelactone hydrolase